MDRAFVAVHRRHGDRWRIAIIVGWALFVAPDADTRFDLLVLIPVVLHILTIEMLSTKYRLEDRYARMAGWQLAIPVSRLLVALVVVARAATHRALRRDQLRGDLAGHGGVGVAAVAIGDARGDRPARPRPRADGAGTVQEPRVSELWAQAWPFGMVAILYPVFFQISTILLKYLGSDKQAGSGRSAWRS